MPTDRKNLTNSPEKKEIFALLIAGSRDYTNYGEFTRITDHLLSQVREKYQILIIEGEARGTDTLAKNYALDKGYKFAAFRADWDHYGKSAGLWRNELMVSELSLYPHRAALFFWDGKSRGTKHCIGEVVKAGIDYKVFDFRNRKFLSRKE